TPHTLAVPLPPQVSPEGQLPQSSWPPQPSLILPQSLPCAAHVVGVQQLLPRHVDPGMQSPQCAVPPQPSFTSPHWAFSSSHVIGTPGVQTLFWQISPGAHLPQSMAAPVQPLVPVPQFFPCWVHCVGGGGTGQTSPRQISGAMHEPQS